MDSLGDMLAKRPTVVEPQEVTLLREFVQNKYNVTPVISLGEFYVTVAVPSSALASMLHFDQQQIQSSCKLTKKLRIRIGQ